MLRITDPARSFLDDVRSSQGIPDHYGIRVFTAARLNGAAPVQIMFRDAPLRGDDINEAAGTRVFVSPEISGADLILDVDRGERGPQLTLRTA